MIELSKVRLQATLEDWQNFDYFLKIRVRDMAVFNRLHGEQRIVLPGVCQIRTFLR
jgi:hypothetical protein